MRKKMYINFFMLIIALASIIFLSGCTQQKTNNPETDTVSIENFAFNPSTVTVLNGTAVTWVNNDNVDHTVIADKGLFNSETLANGQNFSYTFMTPGTYSYHCSIHPSMTGKIIVQ